MRYQAAPRSAGIRRANAGAGLVGQKGQQLVLAICFTGLLPGMPTICPKIALKKHMFCAGPLRCWFNHFAMAHVKPCFWTLERFTLEMLYKDLSSNPCRQMIEGAALPTVKQSFETLTAPRDGLLHGGLRGAPFGRLQPHPVVWGGVLS